MKFTISRSSDQFMSRPLPTQDWTPHEKAVWEKKINNWFVDLNSIEDLVRLPAKTERLIITYGQDCPNVEIDDLGGAL